MSLTPTNETSPPQPSRESKWIAGTEGPASQRRRYATGHTTCFLDTIASISSPGPIGSSSRTPGTGHWSLSMTAMEQWQSLPFVLPIRSVWVCLLRWKRTSSRDSLAQIRPAGWSAFKGLAASNQLPRVRPCTASSKPGILPKSNGQLTRCCAQAIPRFFRKCLKCSNVEIKKSHLFSSRGN